MTIFYEYYLREYKSLTTKEWKDLLDSDDGLFQRPPMLDNAVVGPRLTPDGQITGDTMITESALFEDATEINDKLHPGLGEDQRRFLKELEAIDPTAANEYLLCIIRCTGKWKKDMFVLKEVSQVIEEEESILQSDEAKVAAAKRNAIPLEAVKKKVIAEIPTLLIKEMPKLFQELYESQDSDQLLAKIKELEIKLKEEQKKIKRFIANERSQRPFLSE